MEKVLSKREKKRAQQRERARLLEIDRMMSEKARLEREQNIKNAQDALENDPEYTVHAGCFELLTELIDISVAEVTAKIEEHNVKNSYLADYIGAIKEITSEHSAKQTSYFKDKSDENFDKFQDKTDFIYNALPQLAMMPESNRVQLNAMLKILQKES